MDQNPQSQIATTVDDPLAKAPSPYTIAANQEVLQELPFSTNTQDFTDAQNGFLATLDAEGRVVYGEYYNFKLGNPPVWIWNLGEYAFLIPPLIPPSSSSPPPPPTWSSPPAPESVNPSLWRQAKLNMFNGLFQVTTRVNSKGIVKGIYQVRAFDLSNMTIVEGETGIIVIDPLVSKETAQAALNLYSAVRGAKPVKAVIYTHSHIDHYGGAHGVVNPLDVGPAPPKIQIYAPDGFLDHAISENAFAGNAMGRRATYMYGTFLPKGSKGEVDGGLGKVVSLGDSGLIAPSNVITKTPLDPQLIDGVEIVFMLAQDTEAPSEMLFHFPQFRALCAAEDMTHNLHNLYSIRGSQVRNAMAWWKVINDAIQLWAKDTDVIFAQHHWPMWKTSSNPTSIVDYLKKQRDLYKYILDQSLRLLNHGRTMLELSEMLVLPNTLSQQWYNRGYYGTVNHDSKAVYQRYMGWYDANPANLHTLPPVEASRKYVEYMGHAPAVYQKAQDDFANGEYRWVAEVLNHVIFADPESSNKDATGFIRDVKLLQADALEQLGYQAESGPWRNAYLNGAYELRHGKSPILPTTAPLSASVVNAMTLSQYFDYMGLRFNAPKAEAAMASFPASAPKNWTINWIVTSGSSAGYYAMEFLDYTLPYTSYSDQSQFPLPTTAIPTVTVTIKRDDLDGLAILDHPAGPEFMALFNLNRIQVVGDPQLVKFILDMLDVFPANFNIVTPGQEENLP